MVLVQAILVAALPFVVVVAIFALTSRHERRRAARVRLQILVTDAIHRELGAVAAPELERRRGGGWRVRIRVPAGRPALIGPLVRVAERALEETRDRPVRDRAAAARGGAHVRARRPNGDAGGGAGTVRRRAMYANTYALEKLAESKLADLRAEAARYYQYCIASRSIQSRSVASTERGAPASRRGCLSVPSTSAGISRSV